MIRFVPYVLALYTNYHHAIMVVSGLPLVINVVPYSNLEVSYSTTYCISHMQSLNPYLMFEIINVPQAVLLFLYTAVPGSIGTELWLKFETDLLYFCSEHVIGQWTHMIHELSPIFSNTRIAIIIKSQIQY